jgi:hypothetical protein
LKWESNCDIIIKDTSSKPTSVFAVYDIVNGASNVKRRKWLFWLLLPVGLVVGNCQVIPESRSPETLTTTPILTLTPTFTTTSTLQATATPVPKQAPTPAPIPTDTASRAELDLTSVVGSILSNPADHAGQEVTIVGYYRGWDLLEEAGTGPPVTRSDWVITDSSGAIYVEARGGFDQALGLTPSSHDDTREVLRLVGVVRVNDKGQPYIEPEKLETVTSPMAVPEATGVEREMLLAKVAVEAVELRQLESLPIQIQLFIKGNLPDDCEYELVATQAREGQMIRVTLEGQRPADLSCTTAIQPVTYALRLEGGFEPGDYTLAVNDYQMSFSVSVDE